MTHVGCTWFNVPWTHKTVDFHYCNKCSKCPAAFSFIHILAHFSREWSWNEDSLGNWYMWPLQNCDELGPYICPHKQGLECIPTYGSQSSWGPVISASQCCGFPTATPVTRKVQLIQVTGASVIIIIIIIFIYFPSVDPYRITKSKWIWKSSY
jgi:hypothetical protein